MASLKEKTLILVYFYKTHQTEEGRGGALSANIHKQQQQKKVKRKLYDINLSLTQISIWKKTSPQYIKY